MDALYSSMRRSKTYRIFVKDTNSAFDTKPYLVTDFEKGEIDVELNVYLKSVGITDVIPTGCFSGSCILGTAEGALKEGYNVAVDRAFNIEQDSRWEFSFESRMEYMEYMRDKWHSLRAAHPDKFTAIKAEQDTCDTVVNGVRFIFHMDKAPSNYRIALFENDNPLQQWLCQNNNYY